jgi:hypothetical protein
MSRVLVLVAMTVTIGCQEAPARAVQPLDQLAPRETAQGRRLTAKLTLPSAVKRSHLPRAGLLHGR